MKVYLIQAIGVRVLDFEVGTIRNDLVFTSRAYAESLVETFRLACMDPEKAGPNVLLETGMLVEILEFEVSNTTGNPT